MTNFFGEIFTPVKLLKWVTNRVVHLIFSTKYCNTLLAIAVPSKVAVPLPSSSNNTKDFSVAIFKTNDVSSSSTNKVLFPCSISSLKVSFSQKGNAIIFLPPSDQTKWGAYNFLRISDIF